MNYNKPKLKEQFDTATQGQHFCQACNAAVTLPHSCPSTGLEWVKVPKQGGM